MGKIYYMMGKSASGKDTLYKRLLNQCPDLKPLVLYTTRPRREGEVDGVEYHFITREAFKDLEAGGRVIESRTYHTVQGPWTYATVDDGQVRLENGEYLAMGTLESYEKIRRYFGAEGVVPVYIILEDGIRLERALARERQQKQPRYAELCRRFLADQEDFSDENLEQCGITHGFINENLEECTREILEMIRRSSRNV